MKDNQNIQTIYVSKLLTDKKMEKKEGCYFPKKHYKNIIKTDTDVYCIDGDNKKLLLKFRKNVIPQKECVKMYNSVYKIAQKKNRNRGAASGLFKTKIAPKFISKIIHKDKFRVFYKNAQGKISKDNVGNQAMSNIIGYYDKPDRNHYKKFKKSPKKLCRTTAFTKKNVDKWNQCIPFIKHTDRCFKKLVPDRHKIQHQIASQTPQYKIGDTAFSTITLNYNWRTACHKDKGDLPQGFGNLLVLEKDKCGHDACEYEGGYLGFPQYGVCVDVRQGDFLAMDVHQWHCNTPIVKKKYTKNDNNYGRLSIVCYLRKNMIRCK